MKTKVKIKYCVPCGYLPRAKKYKKALGEKGAEVELIEGDRGVLDVWVDGKLVFSKHQVGRFPETQELLEKFTH